MLPIAAVKLEQNLLVNSPRKPDNTLYHTFYDKSCIGGVCKEAYFEVAWRWSNPTRAFQITLHGFLSTLNRIVFLINIFQNLKLADCLRKFFFVKKLCYLRPHWTGLCLSGCVYWIHGRTGGADWRPSSGSAPGEVSPSPHQPSFGHKRWWMSAANVWRPHIHEGTEIMWHALSMCIDFHICLFKMWPVWRLSEPGVLEHRSLT